MCNYFLRMYTYYSNLTSAQGDTVAKQYKGGYCSGQTHPYIEFNLNIIEATRVAKAQCTFVLSRVKVRFEICNYTYL